MHKKMCLQVLILRPIFFILILIYAIIDQERLHNFKHKSKEIEYNKSLCIYCDVQWLTCLKVLQQLENKKR